VPLNNNDLSQGISVTFLGEQPTVTEPYPCPIDPTTGAPFLRTTRFELYCDASATGFAVLYEMEQPDSDPCLYILRFRTNQVCKGPGINTVLRTLSPGWAFDITFIVCTFVYVVGGALWGYRQSRVWALPHADFWAGVLDLIADGVMFAFTCGRASGTGGRRPANGFGKGSVPTSSSSAFMDGGSTTAAPAFGGPRSYTDL